MMAADNNGNGNNCNCNGNGNNNNNNNNNGNCNCNGNGNNNNNNNNNGNCNGNGNGNCNGNKMGRNILYTEEMVIRAEGYARDGLTDVQIAHNLGISRSTLYKWKREYPEFAEAVKRGKEVVDREVENALFRRAVGYSYPEEKVFLGPGGKPVIVQTTKYYPPDPTAMIFWLKNRKPAEWRDKRDIEVSGGLNFAISLPGELAQGQNQNQIAEAGECAERYGIDIDIETTD